VNESAKLCAVCHESSHSLNAVLSRHERIPLIEARLLVEFCAVHPKFHVEYYCEDCYQPPCGRCKLVGSHSKGTPATHPVIPITEAYNRALEETAESPAGIVERRKAITAKLFECDVMISGVLENVTELEKQIGQTVENAVEQERTLADENTLIVGLVQTELPRTLTEMEALQNSFDDHRKKSGSHAFLRAVRQQRWILGQLADTADLPLGLTVHGDVAGR
jgi:hypothetical protein